MPLDPRLVGKPKQNDGSLPVMEYDYRLLPLTSENIWHAQMAGWDRVLTYDYVADSQTRLKNRRDKRYESITASGVVRSGKAWADEYPFASTVENAGSVFIGHAPAAEQRVQAGMISSFVTKHLPKALEQGRPLWFEVKVLNFPTSSAR